MHRGIPIVRVLNQSRAKIEQLLIRSAASAQVGKHEPLGRSVAANTWDTAKKRVPRDLARNATGIELEDELVLGNEFQIAGDTAGGLRRCATIGPATPAAREAGAPAIRPH